MERFLLAQSHRKSGRPDAGLQEITKLQALTSSRGRYGLDPELFQLRGELLLLQSATNAHEAEQCFRNAIQTARHQNAKMIELTAATELARLLASSGRRHDALAMLSGIYDWFTEGFDTPALKRAKALATICITD